MLDITNLEVSFSGTPLFSGVNFRLNPGEKVALIGRNGAGKTTLLKAIAGETEYSGNISLGKGAKIGFLKQQITCNGEKTVLDEVYSAFESLRKLEKRMEEIHRLMDEAGIQNLHLTGELDELRHRFELQGGYRYKGKTERILKGLGFSPADFNRPLHSFSGGWLMRVELAKILLQDNDILLLDEPTNHLDIHSIIWFENFLKNYRGIVLLVSHDRRFLDTVTRRTIEITPKRVYDVKKNYSGYRIFRKEMLEMQLRHKKNREKEIREMKRLIERFRYKATKASFAQSLIKKLEKTEPVEIDDISGKTMHIGFKEAPPPGKVIFTLENVSKSYGDTLVFSDVNFLIERGSRIAFVGQNGMGKTTLARILTGALTHEGICKRGHGVKIGYFAQNQSEQLQDGLNIWEEMERVADDTNRIIIRDILGTFLFSGDDVYKKTAVLSGGEKNRLALAKMLLRPYNVLILDEPTNHLDIPSKEVLKNALMSFGGSLIVVSHDRDFLKGLTSKVFEFADHKVKEYLGDIEEFLEQRRLDDFRELEAGGKNAEPKEKLSGEIDKKDYKETKRIKNKLQKIEREIEDLERRIAIMDSLIAKGEYRQYGEKDFFEKYKALKNELEIKMKEWENVGEAL